MAGSVMVRRVWMGEALILLDRYHPAGDTVTRVSGGIGFHVIGLGVNNKRGATIAENGMAVIFPSNISVDDLGRRFSGRVHSKVLHIASMMTLRIRKSVLLVVRIEVRTGRLEIWWIAL